MTASGGPATVVFMGTPDFAVPCIDALANSPLVRLALVVCQPDKIHGRHKEPQPPPTKVAALARGIPVAQPTKLRSGDFPELLASLKPDLIVVTAYGRILPQAILDLPRLGCVNVHASLLPRWRGAAPIQWAVAAGDEASGVCLMQMDVGLDTGAVLARSTTPLAADESGQSLHDRLSLVGATLLAESLPALLAGDLVPSPQNHDEATLAPILTREHGQLDFARPAAELERRVRAFDPWPGAWFHLETSAGVKLMKVFPQARMLDASGAPGTVLEADDRLIIACGDGALSFSELQLEGKRRMAAGELLRGFKIAPGARVVRS